MNKRIEFKESALTKISTSSVTRVANEVKTKNGKIGTVGKLKNGLFFKIVRTGFTIF